MQKTHKKLVANFIEQIWNQRQLDRLPEFLHPHFIDHSLPEGFSANQVGMKNWILATSAAFEHQTTIEEHITENDKSVLKIRMRLKHIGLWRDISPTHKLIETIGYRLYRIQDEKMVEHWGLIDGQSIENQLGTTFHGCRIVE